MESIVRCSTSGLCSDRSGILKCASATRFDLTFWWVQYCSPSADAKRRSLEIGLGGRLGRGTGPSLLPHRRLVVHTEPSFCNYALPTAPYNEHAAVNSPSGSTLDNQRQGNAQQRPHSFGLSRSPAPGSLQRACEPTRPIRSSPLRLDSQASPAALRARLCT